MVQESWACGIGIPLLSRAAERKSPSKLRRALPLQRSRATDFFRKQGGTVERYRFTPEFQVGGEAFFFTPKKSEGDKNHGRKQ